MKIFGNVQGLVEGLDYHMARQNLLAANLANVDTPGFRSRDLERTQSFSGALDVELASTNEGHLHGSQRADGSKVIVDRNEAADADGNAVSLDKETVKISSNHMRYETIGTLTTAELSRIAWAAADGKGG